MKKISSFVFVLGMTLLEAKAAPVCSNASPADQATKKVDLTREMPPVKDQDSIGWCYGFTTADLVSHYLYKTKGRNVKGNTTPYADYRMKSFSVSPMAVSTMYNDTYKSAYGDALNNKSLMQLNLNKTKVVAEGGSLPKALQVVKEKGFCFERDVSSEDFSFVADYRCAVKNRCNISEILNIIYDSPKAQIGCNDLNTLQKVFPTLKLQNIKSILVKSAKQDALSNLVNASCKKQFTNLFPIDQPRFSSKTIQIGKQPATDLIKFLDQYLDRGTPVGIMYYADFLLGKNGKSFAHASSIVGKSFNPQTCEVEYILRNSWGRGCGFYQKENPGYKKCVSDLKTESNSKIYATKYAACKKDFKPVPRNPRVRCEEPSGYVYIRKSDLANQVYNTTAIIE